jgi:choline kinase
MEIELKNNQLLDNKMTDLMEIKVREWYILYARNHLLW